MFCYLAQDLLDTIMGLAEEVGRGYAGEAGGVCICRMQGRVCAGEGVHVHAGEGGRRGGGVQSGILLLRLLCYVCMYVCGMGY